jgi:hypothetical protein
MSINKLSSTAGVCMNKEMNYASFSELRKRHDYIMGGNWE